ncbi:MAG: glycosyltransferase [Chitinophagales bacterium]|jgi:glycosyltransferase involved in cell wall biosynthesis|nr:glycosyltransferase [Chitinophagales bacterium]
MHKVRVVIPAKDEDIYLINIINCLNQQDFQDFEILVADSSNTDIVKNICSQSKIVTVHGGLPSEARNNGAADFTGGYLLFLDADVSFNNKFIQNAIFQLNASGADCMSFGFISENSSPLMNLIHWVGTIIFSFMSKIGIAHGIGGAILVKNEIHQLIQGFDESIYIAEDHNYVAKAAKIGKYVFNRNLKVKLSTRRFKKEGVLLLCLKYFVIGIHRLVIGEIRHKKIPYFEIKT